jgi:hypothetical protein
MRFPILALVAMTLVLAGPARADRVLDGNWWVAQTDESKLDYVMGLTDGLPLGARFSGGPDAARTGGYVTAYNSYLAGVSNRSIAVKLDELYGDPQNRSISIPDGVMVTLKEMAGDADTQGFIAAARGAPSVPPPQPSPPPTPPASH